MTQWNICLLAEASAQAGGIDNVGKINADTTKYYYLKDHLGTIRVVLNSTNQVVSANDCACPALDAGTPGAIKCKTGHINQRHQLISNTNLPARNIL